MVKRGFKNLDAIDASSKMLEEAKKLGIYHNMYQDFLGPNKLSIGDSKCDNRFHLRTITAIVNVHLFQAP